MLCSHFHSFNGDALASVLFEFWNIWNYRIGGVKAIYTPDLETSNTRPVVAMKNISRHYVIFPGLQNQSGMKCAGTVDSREKVC